METEKYKDYPKLTFSEARRHRYYAAMVDSKVLETNCAYDKVPDFMSITILSYDPFLVGDMYYEARTCLITHPQIAYDDGRRIVYLYGKGNNNIPGDDTHSKTVAELVKYIVTGEMEEEPVQNVKRLYDIVNSVKKRSEVTKTYMKTWEIQMSHDRELTEQVSDDGAINLIMFGRDNGIDDSLIKQNLVNKYNYDDQHLQELFDKAVAMAKAEKKN